MFYDLEKDHSQFISKNFNKNSEFETIIKSAKSSFSSKIRPYMQSYLKE